jgi:quercetin dioxygenase-like cupin family protein
VSNPVARNLVAVRQEDARLIALPGREWGLLLGPDNVAARNMTLGYAIFPSGSAPPGHVHLAEEEMIYVLSGRGRLVAPDMVVELEPGVAVYIPVGVEHATVAGDAEPLHLLTAFSPPVVPGSYEPPRASGADAGG